MGIMTPFHYQRIATARANIAKKRKSETTKQEATKRVVDPAVYARRSTAPTQAKVPSADHIGAITIALGRVGGWRFVAGEMVVNT